MEKNLSEIVARDKTSSFSRLEDWHPEELNEFALSVTKYFKNQTPHTSQEAFTDPLFPPNENSLLGTCDFKGNPLEGIIKSKGKKVIPEKSIEAGEIIWLRASEIFQGEKYAVFETSIAASDVNQGFLGDCYFLSTLASMCKYPQLLMQIFRTPFVTANNCYEICMRINGVWKVVMVDDYFPCDKNTRKPVFARPAGNEIWVMLLEKAWAKINGGYNHTWGGFNYEVWESLTNIPCFEYRLENDCDDFVYNFLKIPRPPQNERIPAKKDSALTTDMKKAFWSKLLQCTGEKAFMYSYSKKKENGISDNHAYTLICAKERKVNGELIRLVKLRNPWGHGEWQGEWSDQSSKWTQEAKEAFEHTNLKDDGCFYMPYAKYLEHFDYFGVCYNLDPICSRSKTLPKPKDNIKTYVFDFYLSKKSQVNVSVFRKSSRFNKNIDMNASISTKILIAKKSESLTETVEYVEIYNRNIHLRTELELGSYLIFAEVCYARTYYQMDEFYPFDKFRKITVDVAADNFFDLTYIGIDSTSACNALEHKGNITPMFYKKKYLFTPIKAKETINSGYNFLGRTIKFKKNPFVVKFDSYHQAVRYYTKKFPREMDYLNSLEKLKNRDNSVRPNNTTFVHKRLGSNLFYIGEWNESSVYKLEGPGVLVYSDIGLCFGYFKEGKKHGLFTYIHNNIRRRINFNEDKPEGDAFIKISINQDVFPFDYPMSYEIVDGKLKGTFTNPVHKMELEIPNSEDGFDYLWNGIFNLEAESFNEELLEIEKIELNDEEDKEESE